MTILEDHPIIGSTNLVDYPQSPRGIAMWLDEAIWGHRIRTTSSIGNFQFLEFLSVVESLFREDPELLFSHVGNGKSLSYQPRKNMLLRNMIFNNAALNRIGDRPLSDEEKWSKWSQAFCESYNGKGESLDFEYLRQRFESFDNFKAHIQLLQRLSLDPGSSIRWTSRFIFPIGMDAMYTDLGDDLTREAIYFKRNGEILYLMLSRSSFAGELREGFANLLNASIEKNKLLERLLPDELITIPDIAKTSPGNLPPYLPYVFHPAYDRLARDVLDLMGLELPDQDCFEFLIPLFSFHLMLFHLETARMCIGKEGLPPFVCEIVATRPDQVRQASLVSFTENDSVGFLAIEALLENFFEREEIFKIRNSAISSVDKANEIAALFNRPLPTCAWRFCLDLEKFENNGKSPEEFFQIFIMEAKAEHKKKSGDNHCDLGKACGLVSRRGTRSLRYAPTDDFLRMVVVTRVRERIELNAFLADLFDRYRLVIGHRQALQCPEIQESHKSENPFRGNVDRLVRRLESMGLARRMSDGCTYIENPFYEPER